MILIFTLCLHRCLERLKKIDIHITDAYCDKHYKNWAIKIIFDDASMIDFQKKLLYFNDLIKTKNHSGTFHVSSYITFNKLFTKNFEIWRKLVTGLDNANYKTKIVS